MHGPSRSPPGPARASRSAAASARSASARPSSPHALRDELGVDGGDRVATLMWNNAEHVEAYFAIPCHGRGAAHPQPAAARRPAGLDRQPRRRPGDHRQRLAAAAARPAAAAPGDRRAPRGRRPRRPLAAGRGRPRGARVRGADRRRPTAYDWPELDERQAAAMCYTSGTTGDPKGVVYSHRSVYLHSHAGQHGRVDGPDRRGHHAWSSSRSST